MINYLNSFDVFIILETWIEKDEEYNYLKYFENFHLHWQYATRNSVFGRASGGIVLGTKKCLKCKVRVEIVGGIFCILIASGNDTLRIIPVYLNGNNWAEELNNLESLLSDVYTERIIVVGDLNARTSNFQVIDDDLLKVNSKLIQNRQSQDTIINSNGRKLLDFCERFSLTILNGRFETESNGEFTYIGPRGSSVIDYCLTSGGILMNIASFSIGTSCHSDHVPLEIHLELVAEQENTTLMPKLKWLKNKEELFKANISKAISEHESGDGELSTQSVVSSIKKVYDDFGCGTPKAFKNFWYDDECAKMRKQSFKFLNLLRRNYDSEYMKKMYLESNRKYISICRKKFRKHLSKICYSLKDIKNSKDWWKWVNYFKNKVSMTMGDITAEEFGSHFYRVLNNFDSLNFSFAPPLVVDVLLDSNFTVGEMEALLKDMKENKAAGLDRVPIEFYKFGGATLMQAMINIFNKLLNGESIAWSNKSVIIPLFKKGDKNDVNCYRGITLVNAPDKILAGLMLNRLKTWVNQNEILVENQAGFRKNYSTVDNLFCLDFIVNYLWYQNKKRVYLFFIDFKSAFDRVNRTALFYKLYNIGVSSKFIALLQKLYENTENSVWNGSELANGFKTASGVKQGCMLSPLLFSLFLNDLVEFIGLGVRIRNLKVNMLLYADDIVFISDDPSKLQLMINRLFEYCQTWSLEVNTLKSQIMVMRKSGGVGERYKWAFGGKVIDIVDSYRYLGVELKYNLNIRDHLKKNCVVAQSRLNSVWASFIGNNEVSFETKMNLFNATNRSALSYFCQGWGFKKYDEIEMVQRNFVKRVLGLPRNTPNYALRLDCGVEEIFFFTIRCHMFYISKILFRIPETRFPFIFAKIGMDLKFEWFSEWIRMGQDFDVHWNEVDESVWNKNISTIIKGLKENYLIECIGKAHETTTHGLFNKLSYMNGNGLFRTDLTNKMKTFIIRARMGLVGLNDVRWRSDENKICSICNLNKNENIYHFMGECPGFKVIRETFFGAQSLTEQEVVDWLNGRDWNNLYNYLSYAYQDRNYFIFRFNH